jgi:hypothetical protein
MFDHATETHNMKLIIRKFLDVLLPAVLFACLADAANARCIKVANASDCIEVVGIDDVFSDKQRYDNKLLAIEGIAAAVKETTSCSGNDYTTVIVRDPQNGRKITVFAWGHLGIKNEAPIQCSGTFQVKKVVQSRCNGQVRRIPFSDQISGMCETK